jgi:hypothetical protein
MIDMSKKVAPSGSDPLPAREMPTSSGKPKADWPTNPCKLESGLARPTFRGSLPTREAPPR